MFIATRAGIAVSKAPPTSLYTSLNPADKGSAIALSNGNLTGTSSGTGLARTVKAIGAGERKYWEIVIGSGSPSNHQHGLVTAAVGTGVFPGLSGSGLSWAGDGNISTAGSIYDTTAPYTAGDVISFDYNKATDALILRKNNVFQLTISFTGLTHPAFGSGASSVGATFKFGPTMTYAIPSGASLITS